METEREERGGHQRDTSGDGQYQMHAWRRGKENSQRWWILCAWVTRRRSCPKQRRGAGRKSWVGNDDKFISRHVEFEVITGSGRSR